MDKPNALKWREKAAIADMHVRLASSKITRQMQTDNDSHDKTIAELGKAIECIEAAHDAAMEAYNEFAAMSRRKSMVTSRGVRLSAVKQHQSSNATIAELVRK